MAEDCDSKDGDETATKANKWTWLTIGLSSFHFISIIADNISDITILISSTQVMRFLQNLTYDGETVLRFDHCPNDRNACCGTYDLVESASSFALAYGVFIIFFIISIYMDVMLLQMIFLQLLRPQFLQFKSFNRAVLISKIQPILLEGIPQACMAIIFIHLELKPLGINCLQCAINQGLLSSTSDFITTKTCTVLSLTVSNSYFFILKFITVGLQTIYAFLYIMSVGFINKGRLNESYFDCQGKTFANVSFIILVAFPISLFIMIIVASPLAFTVMYFPLPVSDNEVFPNIFNRFFYVHRILFYLSLPVAFIIIIMLVILLPNKKPNLGCFVLFRSVLYYVTFLLVPIIALLTLFYQTAVYVAVLCGYGGKKYKKDEIDSKFEIGTIRVL
ncbi:hypothetical protein TrispH2_002112 [Trichoplax sp. H2]|nr:hypothetical protein TrispH2_002112 [Trichoplax sp. H2]|eukprot:RDD45830.1 hypothetical protein TrispH2_002112 [Trichoplax sp. H2]